MKITKNTQFKTLLNTWLKAKQPMITPSTFANFMLITENHLIPYFGRKKIGAISEVILYVLPPLVESILYSYLF